MSQRADSESAYAGSSFSSSTIGKEKDVRRQKTRLIDEITEEFRDMGVNVGDPCLEAKCDPGVVGKPVKLLTNVFGVLMKQIPIFRYDITISSVVGVGTSRQRVMEFTKRSKEDCVVVDNKDRCRAAFYTVREKYSQVFGNNKFTLYYDLQSILYTLVPLDLGEKNEKVFVLEQSDCTNEVLLQRFNNISMLVKKVSDNFELTLGDLSHLTNDSSKQDHSLQQFIELATSQSVLFNPKEHVSIYKGTSFLMYPERHGFTSEDAPNLSNSKYMAIGARKSMRYVEGPGGRGNQHVGVAVEVKKSPFHLCDQTLMDKAIDVLQQSVGNRGEIRQNDVRRLHSQFKTLHVEVRHGQRPRSFRISGVNQMNAKEHKIVFEGRNICIEEYFSVVFPKLFRYPAAPLAMALERGKTNVYPLELCFIKDCQRVSLNQLTFREITDMHRACAVPPNILKTQLQKTIQSINLHDSPYILGASITIPKNPLKVDARLLPAPKINFHGGKTSIVSEDGKFSMRYQFLLPATCKKWAIFMIPGRSTFFSPRNLSSFIDMFVGCCRNFGMSMPLCSFSDKIDATVNAIKEKFVKCVDERCDFVMFITEDTITNLHGFIKSCEQKYEIVSQDMKMRNASEIVTRNKQETLRNVVCKTNEKLGGLNYSLTASDERVQRMISELTLFIGLGVSHPGAMDDYERVRGSDPSVPSVVGYAANIRSNPYDFIGDFLYVQPRRDEKFSTLKAIILSCLNKFNESRGQFPHRLIIYRNGTSEGQFQMSLQYEVPLIKRALEELNVIDCKLTVLVLQRLHNIRLFTEPLEPWYSGSRANLNVKVGTVVDTQLTHPKQSEFYLNSHAAIKGTARTPRYTVLLDESKFSMDIIEGFSYALTYAYQIINSPTSLPAPVYIALLYAKRGRTLFSTSTDATEFQRYEDGTFNYEAISNDLCYSGTKLNNQRVNA